LVDRLIATSGTTVPATAPSLLLGERPDGAPEGHLLRRARRFPEGAQGEFAEACPGGPAVAQLEDLRRVGVADYLIIPKTALPWLSARVELDHYLQGHYRLFAEDDACRIYDLREPPISAFLDAILPPEEAVIVLVGEYAHLPMAGRHIHRATTSAEVETHRTEGVRYLVVPDARPWRPEDPGVLHDIELRFHQLATRPGVCAIFDTTRNG
jgi:hypothetical protein